MKTLKLILRILLGFAMFYFGLAKFIPSLMMEIPPPAPDSNMATWQAGMMATGYLMPLVGAVEILVGILLLINKFVPLALIMLLPVMLNAMLVHAFMDVENVGGAAVFLTLNIVLMFLYKDSYKSIIKA